MSIFEQIKNNIEEHKSELQSKYNIKEIGIFGSYVKDGYTDKSDLDILVEFNRAPGLFSFLQLKAYLSRLTGVKVDLVMKRVLRPYIGRNILNEVVYL